MGLHCEICEKKPVKGNQITYRGKAKYLGGIGKKITGINRRIFKPNVQKLQVSLNGETTRVRVCAQCIRSGKVQRPIKRAPFSMQSV